MAKRDDRSRRVEGECASAGRKPRNALTGYVFKTEQALCRVQREIMFMTIHVLQQRLSIGLVIACSLPCFGPMAPAQQLDPASVIRQLDAAVKGRNDNLAGYTVTEHYAVYRSNDEDHPVAEMTVMTTYKAETGKSYAIVSQSGSAIVRNLVLGGILEN